MPSVPNHSPDCVWVRKHPMHCRHCKQVVIFCACSCGSMVYLDPPDGGPHDCLHQREKSTRIFNPREMGSIISVRAKSRVRFVERRKRAALPPNGTKLKGSRRYQNHYAEVVGGMVLYGGRRFASLSAAATAATGVNTNGRAFWKAE